MPRTRIFKSGNSQTVQIPADMAYADMAVELEIFRTGDIITIFPERRSLSEAIDPLRRMPRPSSVEPLERIEVPLRGDE